MAKRVRTRRGKSVVKGKTFNKLHRGCGEVIGMVPPATKKTYRRYVTRTGAVVEVKRMSKKAMKAGKWKKCAIRNRKWVKDKKTGEMVATWGDTKKKGKSRRGNKGKAKNRSAMRGAKRTAKRAASKKTGKRAAKRGRKGAAKKVGKRTAHKKRAKGKKGRTFHKKKGQRCAYSKKEAERLIEKAYYNGKHDAINATLPKDAHVQAFKARLLKKRLRAANKSAAATHNPVKMHGGADVGVVAAVAPSGPATTTTERKANAKRAAYQREAIKKMKRDSKGRLVGKG